ncbi:methionyl-tRNA formyltransferase [Brumimicrobium salinarum]|uniref:Methionyl-tRNA formyltransferase n=1 Tax=Brumimicrobium salinarum TaxID=2058658 RepID=A0A2I0R197_9FLAO|nr:methionyl-tRNA formyltransferase [Brumimicrobium salinarum]PKR80352.1 methionyl-tRNA formyltransferase [Brumimicrobium salinarum]
MKEKEDLSIVFMGTPEFAVTILERIIKEGYNIKAVVTAPDRPAGRGRKLKESAVKACAVKNKIPVLQPTNLKDESFILRLKELNADLFIVVAFRMLPKVVWELPKMKTFNLHGSLLPQYRGAAPINWAIINGEKETGVTTFFIDEKIDTGNIIKQDKITIGKNESAGSLHDKMMLVGAETVIDTIEEIRQGTVTTYPQSNHELKEAPKINKKDCLIDFSQSLETIHNFIRGMSPYPTAWLKIKNTKTEDIKTMKVFTSEIELSTHYKEIALQKENGELYISHPEGRLIIKTLQLEGKKRLDATAFLLGFKPEEWSLVL